MTISMVPITFLLVEGAPREVSINEECFHGVPLIHLLFLFYLQEALHGFHTLDFPDLSNKPCFGLSAIHKTLKNNISLCCRHIDLEIMSIRVSEYIRINLCGYHRVIYIFTRCIGLKLQ